MCVSTGLHSAAMADRSPYAALVERLPVRRDELVLRGGRTACWTYGPPDAAHTVVFLHGLRGDHHGLEPIIAHLDALRVVVPDLPGFGASPPLPDDAHDITGYAAWAAELLDAVGGEPVLAGHSFGSIVAAATAAAARPRASGAGQPHRDAPPAARATRLTVGYHRLAAALPERAGTALLRSPIVTRIASVAMATTRTRRCAAGSTPSTAATSRASPTAASCWRRSTPRSPTTSPSSPPPSPHPRLLVAAERDDHRAPGHPARAAVPRCAPGRRPRRRPSRALRGARRRRRRDLRSSCAARSRLPLRHAGAAQRHQPLHRRAGARARPTCTR